MKLTDVFPSDSLKAADLQGREVTVTIGGWELKEFDDGRKLILKFLESDKTLVCNKTNANTIADLYGNDTDHWTGNKITLFPAQTDFQGKQVPCIRVKIAPAPVAVVAPAVQAEGDQDIPF